MKANTQVGPKLDFRLKSVNKNGKRGRPTYGSQVSRGKNVQRNDKEEIFWNRQTKKKYVTYEKKVYSAFREKEYIQIIKNGFSGLGFKKNGKVLDMGCGAGVSSIVLSNLGFDVVGIDISSNLINQAREISRDRSIPWLTSSGKVENEPIFITGDITKLNFKDESFDVCFLVGVLHHFPNYDVVLKQIHRLLAKDGVIIACEPNALNLPYRLSFYLVNRKKGVTPNEGPLLPSQVERDLSKYFKNVKLSQFREDDVPFLRQMGVFGKSIFGRGIKLMVLFLKNSFAPKISRGTFFIVSGQKT